MSEHETTPEMMDDASTRALFGDTEPGKSELAGSSCSVLFMRITDMAWELYVLENHIRTGSEDSANYWHKMSHEDQICYAFAAGKKAAQNNYYQVDSP
jgi:hypothetical protein